MKLEDAINDALRRGEFVELSVHATATGFSATFASASRAGGYSMAEAMDPIVAMMRAIGAAPMVRKPTVSCVDEYTRDQDAGLANSLAAEIDDPALL